MYLFFDCETTGLPKNWKAPVTDLQNWPRLVQLACLQYTATGELLVEADFIVRPDGFTIPIEASRIHGISTERALSEGKPITEVLENFLALLRPSSRLIAHNMAFDEKIVGAELLRAGFENELAIKNRLCTMKETVNFCALPGQYGFKWPKLDELHQKVFQTGFNEAHNAAVDIRATAKCFWELKNRGIL